MVRLKPSFARIAISVDSWILMVIVLGYLRALYIHDPTWTTGYICSFSVLLVLAPSLVWLMFVPRIVEYSDAQVRIATLFRDKIYPWKRLESYGSGSIFSLRFKHEFQGYQIWSKAYSKEDWSRFTHRLNAEIPDDD